MGKRKKKITKLNEEQYLAYIMSLKDEPALYNGDGKAFVPDAIVPEDVKTGDKKD